MTHQLPNNNNVRHVPWFGILVLIASLLLLGIASGTTQNALADKPALQKAQGVADKGLPQLTPSPEPTLTPTPTDTPQVEPELAILEYVVAAHPDWTCGSIGGTPGHRTLGCYTGAGHSGSGSVDNYGDPVSAQANWQQRRDHAQSYYPVFQGTSWSGYPGYHGEGPVPPYNFFTQEDFYWADVRVLGGIRVDDTNFHYAPDIASAIMNAASALGYLPPPTPTPTPGTLTPSPTSTLTDATATFTATADATITVSVTATVTATATVQPTPECGLAWRVVSNPLGGDLNAVDAISPQDVWAVGSNGAMHFDGNDWTVVSVPITGLLSVSAAATDDVWATDGGSVIHWDGTAWSLDRNPPNPPTGAGYSDIEALSANDVWIVGRQWTSYAPSTLAMHWDGVSWSVTLSPSSGTRGNSLSAVSGASHSDVWAVGSYPLGIGGIIVRWNANQWEYDTYLFGLDYFSDVHAIAPDDVWVVGTQAGSVGRSVLAYYDGTSWSDVPGPNIGWLFGVDGLSSNDVWAVGADGISHWDGSIWSQVTAPNMVLRGVKAVALDEAWAVGDGGLLHYSRDLFSDVPPGSPFYNWIQCLACRGIISGYEDGTFRPGNEITRGQIAKMVSNAAGINDDPGPQVFEDVDEAQTFYIWINRLANRDFMGGYDCGGEGEPCGSGNLPYFRPSANATRGQLAKIVSNAAGLVGTATGQFYADVAEDHLFYLWIMRLTDLGVMSGYPCGGEGEPCDDQSRPYFRSFNNVTRGQTSKIVANTFFPACQTRLR